MNVCFICEDYDQKLGGVAVNAITLAEKLSSRGHTIVVITSRPKGLSASDIVEGVHIYRTRSLRMPRTGFYFSVAGPDTIRAIVRRHSIELVHFHTATPLTKHGYSVAKELDLRRIYTFNALPEHFSSNSVIGGLFERLVWVCLRALCNGCDLTICPSHKLKQQLVLSGITTPISFLSNAMGFEEMSAATARHNSDSFVVLFVGRLMVEKDVPLLISAFSRLVEKHEHSELWIVGSGYLRRRLEALCAARGIGDRVKFLGFVEHSNLGCYYQAADVLVLPSTVETQGMVAIEAMYFATPVIVTDTIVSAAELVDNGRTGFIVGRSAEQLAEKLVVLAEDGELRASMGKASKLKSAAFGTDHIVQSLERMYESVIANSHGGPSA